MHRWSAIALGAAAACGHRTPSRPESTEIAPHVEMAWMDHSADPCDDFYRYVCGNWIELHPLRPGQGIRGSRFAAGTDEVTHRLLEDYAAGRLDANVPDAALLGTFYAACTADGDATATLQSELAKIDAVSDGPSLARAVAHLHHVGATPLFVLSAEIDLHDTSRVVAQLAQAGLGLSLRDGRWWTEDPARYLAADDAAMALRAAYAAHVQRMLVLAGEPAADAAVDATAVLRIETALARGYQPSADTDDPRTNDHPLDRSRLVALAPHFDWATYFAEVGVDDSAPLNAAWPDYLVALDGVLARSTPAELRGYLRWQLVHEVAAALGPRFERESLVLRAAVSGVTEAPPRWYTCFGDVDRLLGDALGRAYVARAFSPAARDEALALLHGIEAAAEDDLATLAWLDSTTRARAIEKVRGLHDAVGYSDTWTSYATLSVGPDYLADVLAAGAHVSDLERSRLGKPVDLDRMTWRSIGPQTPDTQRPAQLGAMLVPAAWLQPPFLIPGKGPGNYALLGRVMGHELTHGFDLGGRFFAADGSFGDWWSPAVVAAYAKRTQCLVDQYSAIEVVPGAHVDGERTLAENVADNGGLALAWRAWRAARDGQPPLPRLAGMDEDQQFFVSTTQSCSVATDAYLRAQLVTHAYVPWAVRAVVPAMNLPAFAEAFGCKTGSRMAPADRCVIW